MGREISIDWLRFAGLSKEEKFRCTWFVRSNARGAYSERGDWRLLSRDVSDL
jgi:hypothetical protein